MDRPYHVTVGPVHSAVVIFL